MSFKNYQGLEVWQKAMDLVVLLYRSRQISLKGKDGNIARGYWVNQQKLGECSMVYESLYSLRNQQLAVICQQSGRTSDN